MTLARPDSTEKRDALYENILQAFKQWDVRNSPSPLNEFALFRNAKQQRSEPDHVVTHRFLKEGIAQLESPKEKYAEILRLRFIDGLTSFEVANRLSMAQSTVERKQREAIYELVDIFSVQEQQLRQSQIAQLEERLEAPFYDRLFGIDQHLQELTKILLSRDGLHTVLIQGIGGIGKTSLADAFTRRAIEEELFGDFGWVSARQQRLHQSGTIGVVDRPALTGEALLEALAKQLFKDIDWSVPFPIQQAFSLLQARLKQVPHLIVVDNLETVKDVEALMPTLQRLSNPSKFLLTSRKSIQVPTAIYSFILPELYEKDALALVRYEAERRNAIQIASSDDEELKPIFDTVGGNPLALKLIVGQSHIHSMHDVIENLQEARGEAVEELYTYIYRYAWNNLDDISRRVLVAMPFAPQSGGDLALLARVSGLGLPDLSNGLANLVNFNLINRTNDLTESRYSIHSLTRTFLHNQVVAWQ